MWDVQNIQIQRLNSALWNNTAVDVLRLDQLHPVVSGNKWFKLKYYLQDAIALQKNTIATFGGPHSNHIVATAFAGKEAGLHTVGIIRGEAPAIYSATLLDAAAYGMRLYFVSRESYRNKTNIMAQLNEPSWYWVNEGGAGKPGADGAMEILKNKDTGSYTHIACACGTGTTLAGLVQAADERQVCIGVSALKGFTELREQVMELVPVAHQDKRVEVMHDYHFGGYAKHPPELIHWMNELWRLEQLPTDIVYTSKLCFAVHDLLAKGYFEKGAKILIIHSGGLQGNRSLPEGTLEFL